MTSQAEITGWGKCLPPAVLSNNDISTVVDTSDEWIRARSGIEERRISHVGIEELGSVAGARALAAAGLEPADIDLVLLATNTPDTIVPCTAAQIQRRMGIGDAAAMDLVAGCSGFVYGLVTAAAMISSGAATKALLIGADRVSYLINWSRRETAVLFGDGAGAVVLEAATDGWGLLSSSLGCQAAATGILQVRQFGAGANRFADDTWNLTIDFDGREIFKRAVKGMGASVREALAGAGIGGADVDLVVPHQANLRIIEALARSLRVPMEKVMVNIQRYGNTSAASIPIALTEALEAGRVEPGALVVMAAFGAGLTRAAATIHWGDRTSPIGHSDASLPPCDQSGLGLLAEAIERTTRPH